MIATPFMSNERLKVLIEKTASEILENQLGFWKFKIGEALVFVITDESHNRMRIMSPIVDIASISQDEWLVLMSANFDRALDARFCVNDNVLWSAFIHPLQELEPQQFLNALDQVVTLAGNYGTTYSSGYRVRRMILKSDPKIFQAASKPVYQY